MKVACAVALVLLVACSSSSKSKSGPTRTRGSHKVTWQSFAPRGFGFSITMPGKPQRIRDWIGDHDPNGYRSVDAFGSEFRRPLSAFVVVALLPSDAMLKEEGGHNNLKGLEILIGGDDAEPASSLPIKVHGLSGTEYIYYFREEHRHVKGRVIDGGRRIFVLLYAADEAASLNSVAARRFFNSFKVVRAFRVR